MADAYKDSKNPKIAKWFFKEKEGNMKKFTLKEHIETGKEMKKLHKSLFNLIVKVRKTYPKSSKQFRKAGKVLDSFSEFKSAMDDCVCENKNISDAEAKNVYYGPWD